VKVLNLLSGVCHHQLALHTMQVCVQFASPSCLCLKLCSLFLQIMFVVWWITAVWFFTWVIYYGQVRNWFREVCNLSEAGTVYVWAPAEVNVLTANASSLVGLVRRAKVCARPCQHVGLCNVHKHCTEDRAGCLRGVSGDVSVPT